MVIKICEFLAAHLYLTLNFAKIFGMSKLECWINGATSQRKPLMQRVSLQGVGRKDRWTISVHYCTALATVSRGKNNMLERCNYTAV